MITLGGSAKHDKTPKDKQNRILRRIGGCFMRLLSLRPGGSRIPKTSQRFYNSESSKAKKNVFGGPRASQPKSQNEKLLHCTPRCSPGPIISTITAATITPPVTSRL